MINDDFDVSGSKLPKVLFVNLFEIIDGILLNKCQQKKETIQLKSPKAKPREGYKHFVVHVSSIRLFPNIYYLTVCRCTHFTIRTMLQYSSWCFLVRSVS